MISAKTEILENLKLVWTALTYVKNTQDRMCRIKLKTLVGCIIVALLLVHALWLYGIVCIGITNSWTREEAKKRDRSSLLLVKNSDLVSYKSLISTRIFFYIVVGVLTTAVGATGGCLGIVAMLYSCYSKEGESPWIISMIVFGVAFVILVIVMSILIPLAINIRRKASEMSLAIATFDKMIFQKLDVPTITQILTINNSNYHTVIQQIFAKLKPTTNADKLAKIIFTLSLYKYYVITYISDRKIINQALNALKMNVSSTIFKTQSVSCYAFLNRESYLSMLTDDVQFYEKYLRKINIKPKIYQDARGSLNISVTNIRNQKNVCDQLMQSDFIPSSLRKGYRSFAIAMILVFTAVPIFIILNTLFTQILSYITRSKSG